MKCRTKIGIAIVLTVALVGTARVLFQRPSEPFSSQNRVLSSISWALLPYMDKERSKECYTWLDNDTIIFALPDGKDKYKAMRQWVSTQRTFPAELIPHVKPLEYPYVESVSPYGKWLMVSDPFYCSCPHYLFYALDGSGGKRDYALIFRAPTWLPDGQSFLGCEDAHRQWSRISLTTGKRIAFTSRDEIHDNEDFTYEDDPAITPQPILQRTSFDGKILQTSIEPLGKTTRFTALNSASPLSDRLLWYQRWSETSWWNKMMARFSYKSVEPINYEEWFITDTEGKNRRRLTTMQAVELDT